MLSDNELASLLEEIGVEVVIEHDGGSLVVTGLVESESMHQAALDVLADAELGLDLVDNIEVSDVTFEGAVGLTGFDQNSTATIMVAEDAPDAESLEPGDFTDQTIAQDPFTADGPSGTAVDEEINEGEESYVPPIDPVRNSDGEFIGGFAVSSMDTVELPLSSDGRIGDEAIADAVRQELIEDSATAELTIDVEVRNGIVHLRGEVADLDDAENAEDVASRVPGVSEVREELRISNV